MALGVLNNLSAIYAENNLNNTNTSLQTVLQQLSSGSKINSGADDAAGLSLVNGLAANSTALTQSETNATEGVGLLDVADGALSQVTNLLNRAVTLATEASNGTLNSTQGAAANQEYQSILAEVNNIGSTTTYNQQSVFAGNTVAIYTGDSSTAGSSIDNLYIRTLSSANVGDTEGAMAYSGGQNNAFIDLSKNGTIAAATDGLSGTSTTIAVSYLTKGSGGSAVTATANVTAGAGTNYSNTAQGLISAINNAGLGLNASFATATQAGTSAVATAEAANGTSFGTGSDTGIEISGTGVGTGTNGAGDVGAVTVAATSDLLAGTLTIVGSDGKSHAILLGTANSTDTLANLESTINADGYGVTASLNAAPTSSQGIGTILTLSAANSAITVSGTNVTDTPTSAAAATLSTLASLGTASTIGSTIQTLTVNNRLDTLGGTLTVVGVNGVDVGGAPIALGTPGSTDTLANLAADINNLDALTPALGISASVDSTGTILTIKTAAAGDTVHTPSVTSTATATDTTTADPVTGLPTQNTAYYAQVGTFTVAATADALTGTLQIGQNTITLGAGSSTNNITNLAAYINAGKFGVTATLNAAKTAITFTSPNSATTFGGAPKDAGNAISVNTAANADFSEYYTVGITGNVSDSSTGGGTAITGITSDTNGTGQIATTSYSDAAGENLSVTDLLNQTDAVVALNEINVAISDAAALDGYIGGQINTLNSVSQVLSTQQENVVSAQNAVQATDYASATSNMSKYEILSQTGIAALAQANTVQQEVTKLLQ